MVIALPRRLRELRSIQARKRLARAVRLQAEKEHERRLAAGVVDLNALAGRSSLYGEIARSLEDDSIDLDDAMMRRLRTLLADPGPLVDYGPYARARDAEIEAIRDELRDGGRL